LARSSALAPSAAFGGEILEEIIDGGGTRSLADRK
jgi:hypothetical protein